MTIIVRRFIYIIFILIFLLAAPILLLYTAGYNYNFKKGSFLKTGVLLLEAVPADAHFKIDERSYGEKLPVRLANLKPKDYTIEVQRDNYWPWKKTLTLGSGETIFATNIFLPKKSSSELVLDRPISQALFLEKGHQFILVTSGLKTSQIILFNIANKQSVVLVDALAEKNPILTVSPNEKYLLVETARQSLAINLSKPGAALLLQGKKGALRQIVFETDNDFVIYGLDGSSVVRRNLVTDEQRALYPITGSNFLVHQGFIYWTAATANSPFSLERVALFIGNRETPQTIINIPRGRYRLWAIDGLVALYDLGTQKISLVNPETRETFAGGQLNGFNPPRNHSWLYWNQSEIFINDLKNQTSELVTRLGQTIIKATRLKKYPYVLYATDKTISLIEEDNRQTKNIYPLATLEKIQNLFLFEDKIIYIVARGGLYSLAIQ